MEKGFEKALEIYSVLATGQSISAKDKETAPNANSAAMKHSERQIDSVLSLFI